MDKHDDKSEKQFRWMQWLMHQFQDKKRFSQGKVVDPWNWLPDEIWSGFQLQASGGRKAQLGNDPALETWRFANFIRSFLTRVAADDIGEPPQS